MDNTNNAEIIYESNRHDSGQRKAKGKKNFLSMPALFYITCFAVSFLLWEFSARLFSIGFVGQFPIFMVLFRLCAAVVLGTVCALLPKKAGRITALVLTVLLFIPYGVQLVYYHIFDSFCSVAQLGMGADAITNFGKETLIGIGESVLPILILFIPVAAEIVFLKLKLPGGKKSDLKKSLLLILLALVIYLVSVLSLPLAGKQLYSPYDIYHDTFVLSRSERTFGIMTTARLEIEQIIFPRKNSSFVPITPVVEPETEPAETEEPTEPKQDDPPPIIYGDNVTDVDFAALAESTDNAKIADLCRYFAAQTPTKQNEYTGKYKDYNLIVLCCESFSQYVIDKDRTPVLYRMANEGFHFNNYYNTVCDNTSNGEYALMMGLLADTSLLGKGWDAFYDYNSFTSAKDNLLPFCLGNQMRKKGYLTYAIHNYFGNYYGRDKTHPSMGYTFCSMYYGDVRFRYDESWPTSDVSMMEQGLPLLLKEDENGVIQPFHAYFLTFSGHMWYNFVSNDMAIKNQKITEEMPYSTPVRAYLAGQQELEYALEYLISELERTGQLDHTLIALTADHYPYNLGLDKLSELSGKEMDEQFDKYKGCFLLWSASMTESVEVDVPCCTLDILPTLSNLMGLEYDSRLLMGTDILSNSPHMAILEDRSFVTDRVKYNGETGKATVIGEALPDGYIDSRVAAIRNKFLASNEILYNDFYRFLYGEK